MLCLLCASFSLSFHLIFLVLSPSLAAFIENLSQLSCNNLIVPRLESGIPRNTRVLQDRDGRISARCMTIRVKIQSLQSWPAIGDDISRVVISL